MSRPRYDVSGIQVSATVLAAVVGALLASYLGVVGTIVGTAVASGVTTLGSAIFRYHFGRTSDRVKAAAPVLAQRAQGLAGTWGPWGSTHASGAEPSAVEPSADDEPGDDEPGDGEPGDGAARKARRKRLWIRYAIPAISVFVLVIIGVTVWELAAGKPLSSVVWGKAGSGTSIGSVFTGHDSGGSPSSPSPSTPAQPSSTATATSQATATPTATQPASSDTSPAGTSQPTADPSSASAG
jgi:hypothetical protein